MQFRAGPGHELIDIAMIVGEEDVSLNMLGWRPRIMFQSGQREIGAQPVEQRERPLPFRIGHEQAIGDLVPDLR